MVRRTAFGSERLVQRSRTRFVLIVAMLAVPAFLAALLPSSPPRPPVSDSIAIKPLPQNVTWACGQARTEECETSAFLRAYDLDSGNRRPLGQELRPRIGAGGRFDPERDIIVPIDSRCEEGGVPGCAGEIGG